MLFVESKVQPRTNVLVMFEHCYLSITTRLRSWFFASWWVAWRPDNLQGICGVSQVASIFDGSCQIHWQDPQRKLATTAKSTNRIRSGSYRALPNSHRIRFRIRWRVAKFRQDPQTGSAQPLPNSTQDPQDRIRNHCQISTGSVKQDPQPLQISAGSVMQDPLVSNVWSLYCNWIQASYYSCLQ